MKISFKDFPASTGKLNQSEFARLIGRDRSGVSRLYSKRILSHASGWLSSLHKYIEHIQEQAAGRGDGALVQERTRLSKLEGDRITLELKRKRRELVHVESAVEALTEVNVIVRTRLLALPQRLVGIVPGVSPSDVTRIREEVYDCMTELSRMELPEDITRKLIQKEKERWGDLGNYPIEDSPSNQSAAASD